MASPRPAAPTCLHLLLSASGETLARCRRAAAPGDTVICLDDGVMLLLDEAVATRFSADIEVLVSAPCAAARGLEPAARSRGVTLADDAVVAQRLRRHARCLSWR